MHCRFRGNGFKGADTTFVLKFLVFKFENVLASEDLGDDRLYFQAVLDCLKASDGFLSSLYKAGLFLWRRRLVKIVRLGNEMIASYTRCAGLAVSRSLARFKLSPKYHMLMHVVLQLMVDRDANRTPVNPMAYSCPNARRFYKQSRDSGKECEPSVCAGEKLGSLQDRTRKALAMKKMCDRVTFVMFWASKFRPPKRNTSPVTGPKKVAQLWR